MILSMEMLATIPLMVVEAMTLLMPGMGMILLILLLMEHGESYIRPGISMPLKRFLVK